MHISRAMRDGVTDLHQRLERILRRHGPRRDRRNDSALSSLLNKIVHRTFHLVPDRAQLHLNRHLERRQGLQLGRNRSEEHTSELQSLMRTSYAVFCLKKKKIKDKTNKNQ